MNYNEFINNILETRGRFSCGDEYHERHHIIPRCMGGTDNDENLIDLFAREHFEAHRLLALENPENSSLVYAWWMMAHVKDKNQKRVEISAEEYEEVKRKYVDTIKGRPAWNKGVPMTEEQKIKLSKAKVGIPSKLKGVPMSDMAKQHMRENHADFSCENHPMYGKHHSEGTRQKISESHKGKKLSDETKKKLSELNKGENNHFYGKTHTEEAKEKMRNSKSKCKPVRCIETGEIYRSTREAQRITGVWQTTIVRVCKGKQELAGGYHWEYVEEPTQ